VNPVTARARGSIRTLAVTLAALTVLAGAASAQTAAPVRVRTTRATVVMERPRGDSVVLGKLPAGTVVEELQRSGRWVEITALSGTQAFPWRRGWVIDDDLEFVDGPPAGSVKTPKRQGELMIRGFGQYGGVLFTANDSFDAMFDTSFGTVYGGGGQVVFANGLFLQGSVERFQDNGVRLIVSDEQVFRTDLENTVTVTPILATVGFRDPRPGRVSGYAGAGVGWHQLKEESPSLSANYDEGHVGYHVLGGAEFRLAAFLWLAGEVQWASVPDAIGDPGIGAVFDERDLGGTTFRVKVLVGR
jgi:opacity protein-like surface antigen